MENQITLVFCSKEKDNIESFVKHLTETCGCPMSIMSIHNPDGLPLAKIYHDIVESENVKTNIIVFIHDDVEFLKSGWGLEVLRLFNQHKDYGIIGVAGSAQFDENGAWWNYDKKFGQVLHRSEGKSWLTAFSPLLKEDLQEVAVIDGLFMAIDKTKIGANFDETFEGFDHYDTSMCLANVIAHKCKIGVTTNIRMAHNSVGALKDSWFKNKEILNEKFGKYYPIDILDEKWKKRFLL